MRLAALDWREAFWRLRAVLYLVISAAALALAVSSAPETKPAYSVCAEDLRDLMRSRNPDVTFYQLYPGATDTEFCERHANGPADLLETKIAMKNIAAAKSESLLWEQAKHFGEFAGGAALVVMALEIAAQALLWVLAGLLRPR
jgi:hypothetical protein